MLRRMARFCKVHWKTQALAMPVVVGKGVPLGQRGGAGDDDDHHHHGDDEDADGLVAWLRWALVVTAVICAVLVVYERTWGVASGECAAPGFVPG